MIKKALVTGSGGLLGFSVSQKFLSLGYIVNGMDINMREVLFGINGSVTSKIEKLSRNPLYNHIHQDVRDKKGVDCWIDRIRPDVIVHCASQPSHDWAATNPVMDFDINCNGTLNLLEAARSYCLDSPFIFISSSKIYGSKINEESYIEEEKRFTISNPLLSNGISETYYTDDVGIRSMFGASKYAADIMVREYGRYYNMPTVCLRSGCITGPNHAGVEQHGFLSYIVKCAKHNLPYKIYGYKGKQVRDNIHANDLADAIIEISQNPPKPGEIFNIGGGFDNSCSILEAIELLEGMAGKKMDVTYVEKERVGDHIFWISDMTKFKTHFLKWKQKYSLVDTITEIYNKS